MDILASGIASALQGIEDRCQCRVARLLRLVAGLAVACLLAACSREPGPDTTVLAEPTIPADAPDIDRYRAALDRVTDVQRSLAAQTALMSGTTWSAVARRSLELSATLQAHVESLKAFPEAASAATALQADVARLQQTLRHLDAETWQDRLPDLLLVGEAIRSGVDELLDLGAPEPDLVEDPDHHHELDRPGEQGHEH